MNKSNQPLKHWGSPHKGKIDKNQNVGEILKRHGGLTLKIGQASRRMMDNIAKYNTNARRLGWQEVIGVSITEDRCDISVTNDHTTQEREKR